ncbi:pre-tRNA nuclear export protein [Geranomyces variabilis]|nr:pre-tRNA nuclear export protein [Geranomyces variabilis]
MEENLERATAVLYDQHANPALHAQATAFCTEIQNSPEGWQICLKLFVREPPSTDIARFFCLQTLEDLLRRRYATLGSNQRIFLRQTLWSYLTQQMNPAEKVFIRNKFVQAVVLLFANQYPSEWPSFFDDLLSLIRGQASAERQALMVDSFLRISHAIDDEVANQMIARDPKETARNTLIKDAMRETANVQLTETWREVLMSSYQSSAETADACLRLFARYVSWIDINLVVSESFIAALYQFLGQESLRSAACDCLTEIVGKGMLPLDKLNLVQALNVTSVLEGLDSEDLDFSEQVGRLINVFGLELCQIWDATAANPEARDASFALLQQVFPFLVKYLGSETDEASTNLFPFLQAYTTVLKSYIRIKGEDSIHQFKDNILALLRTIILKMKYDEDANHAFGDAAGPTDAEFIEMRKNLKKHFDAVGAIDKSLFVSFITSVVSDTFDKYSSEPSSVSWSDAELALHLVYICGESIQGPGQFSTGEGASLALAPLGQMISKMITSNVSQHPHVSIPFEFFENVARYPLFFETFPAYIPSVLEAFVDRRGLHNDVNFIRIRAYYLFRQFVHALKSKLSPFVNDVLNNIQGLLVVSRPPPFKVPASIDEDSVGMPFDSQLYVYEAVGILISVDGVPTEKQAELLQVGALEMGGSVYMWLTLQRTVAQAVLTPLMHQTEEIMRNELYKRDTPDNVVFTLQLNHLIRAIGSISKGFPDVDHLGRVTQGVPPWVSVFQQALTVVAAVLERMHESELIRDASRFAFQRMVGCMGHDILNSIGPLVTAGLLTNSTRRELVDFLPFISHITHKFKPAVFPIMNELIGPLLERVYASLNLPVEGTDDAMSLQELRKGYLNLLAQIFNSDMEGILVTEQNMPQLNTVLQSVLHFVKESGDPSSQKLAFSVLSKCVISWGAGDEAQINGASLPKNPKTGKPEKPAKLLAATAPKSALPGFESFLYGSILPILFQVPLNAAYDPKDGQCYLVMSEIASLHKTAFVAQGGKYVEYLRGRFLPEMGCDPRSAEAFLDALQNKDNKGLREVLAAFLSEHRKTHR